MLPTYEAACVGCDVLGEYASTFPKSHERLRVFMLLALLCDALAQLEDTADLYTIN